MQTRSALKALSKGEVGFDRVSSDGPLAQNSDWLLKRHAEREAETQASQRRHEAMASMPAIQAAQMKIAKVVGEKVLPDDTPIITRFDAHSAIKSAAKENPKDTGLRMFATHLSRLWHEDPMGTLSAGVIGKLRDHYQNENPRSVVGEMTDKVIPKYSFNNLPVANLVRIANSISTQEDYNAAIERYNLAGDDARSIRARTFIRELVNRKAKMDYCDACDRTSDKCACDMPKSASLGRARRSRAGDIANRVASRINKDAQEFVSENPGADSIGEAGVVAESDIDATADSDAVAEDVTSDTVSSQDLGVDGSGMMSFAKKEQDELFNFLASSGEGLSYEAVAPPGWEKTVEDMKGDSDIDNPFALAWWMKSKGYKPGGKKDKKEAADKKDSGGSQPEFHPEINQQQDPQENIKPGDGSKVLKAALTPENPLVDDGMHHFPIDTEERYLASVKTAESLEKCPDWWLGSLDELVNAVKTAEIPEAFKKNIEKMKGKGKGDDKKEDKKDDKKKDDDKKSNPFAASIQRCAEFGITADNVEEAVSTGGKIVVAGYSIGLKTDNDMNLVEVSSKKGSKQYPFVNMDNAISDFMYLVGTSKKAELTAPEPMFYVREGLRLQCFGCHKISSYEMPKEASDLSCGHCETIISSASVTSALESGNGVFEEQTLVAFVPLSKQEEFGDKFAKAAGMMGTNDLGADGSRAEAYAVNVPNEKMADVWDFLVEAGFKPIAQEMTPPAMPAGVMAADDMPLSNPPVPEMESLPMPEMGEDPMAGGDVPDLGSPGGDAGWADHQMVQAAMMHYYSQGSSIIEAISQFTKDYGDGFDPETVMQVAATVYGINLGEVKVAMQRQAGDLPSTNVNQQQPDAEAVPSKVLGPDSDTHGEIPKPSGIKPQVNPQGNFADTSTEPDSDNRDPGDYGAGKPKAQHPATDQKGTGLSDTDLGPDSETQMGGLMKQLDTVSKTDNA